MNVLIDVIQTLADYDFYQNKNNINFIFDKKPSELRIWSSIKRHSQQILKQIFLHQTSFSEEKISLPPRKFSTGKDCSFIKKVFHKLSLFYDHESFLKATFFPLDNDFLSIHYLKYYAKIF